MSTVGALLSNLLLLFLLLLFFRVIMEWVFQLSRSYHPAGFMAIVLEVTYSVTDPPLKFLRRFIPPLRLGAVAIDLAFIVLFIIVGILRQVLSSL